jgi:hypothetical protein
LANFPLLLKIAEIHVIFTFSRIGISKTVWMIVCFKVFRFIHRVWTTEMRWFEIESLHGEYVASIEKSPSKVLGNWNHFREADQREKIQVVIMSVESWWLSIFMWSTLSEGLMDVKVTPSMTVPWFLFQRPGEWRAFRNIIDRTG